MFQPSAFQNNAFQTAVMVAVIMFFNMRTVVVSPPTEFRTTATYDTGA